MFYQFWETESHLIENRNSINLPDFLSTLHRSSVSNCDLYVHFNFCTLLFCSMSFNILSHQKEHNNVHNSCISTSLTYMKILTVIISVLCLCVNCILSCSGIKPTRSKSGITNFLKYFLFVVLIVIHLFSGSAFTEYTDNGYGRFLILHSRLLLVILLLTNGCKHTK
jgi:hypothetical protein